MSVQSLCFLPIGVSPLYRRYVGAIRPSLPAVLSSAGTCCSAVGGDILWRCRRRYYSAVGRGTIAMLENITAL